MWGMRKMKPPHHTLKIAILQSAGSFPSQMLKLCFQTSRRKFHSSIYFHLVDELTIVAIKSLMMCMLKWLFISTSIREVFCSSQDFSVIWCNENGSTLVLLEEWETCPVVWHWGLPIYLFTHTSLFMHINLNSLNIKVCVHAYACEKHINWVLIMGQGLF